MIRFQYIESGGERLAVSIHNPAMSVDHDDLPVVVICHGFIGTRVGVDRLFVQAAERFASAGIGVVRFDYVGCGESSGEYGNNRFDDFVRQTRDVIHTVAQFPSFQRRPLVLLGHSLGGAVATVTAALDRRVERLVLWAPVAYPYQDIVRIATQGRGQVEEETVEHRGYVFPPSFFASLAYANPLKSAEQFSGDVLLVHGTADRDIPVAYADVYREAFGKRRDSRFLSHVIPEADHTFSSISQGANYSTSRLIGFLNVQIVSRRENKMTKAKRWPKQAIFH
ncbi:Alpha/beta hydrolase family protein [Geobacillus sp. BCO2]|nr:Alpha/beta hydrolase family protein [Geobacillus sp. BCO2]